MQGRSKEVILGYDDWPSHPCSACGLFQNRSVLRSAHKSKHKIGYRAY